MEKNELFTSVKPGKALAIMAIPTIISQVVILVYNLADIWFIGRTNDPYMLAKYLGIDVAYKHFGNLKGMYTVVNRCSYIYLHDELDEATEKLVLTHELGHHFFHKDLAEMGLQEYSLYDMTSKPEMEANIFAANMLISDDEILFFGNQDYTSEQAASELSVPNQLVQIKLMDMNRRGYDFKLRIIPRADFLG